MTSGLVKWVDRSRNSSGEDGILGHESFIEIRLIQSVSFNHYEVKKEWNREEMEEFETDVELRKHRDQKGLETPVVYAVNDVH